MTDDISDIAGSYNGELEREHARLDRHQLEHDLTWRYLSQYLPSRGSILEVGCATGRYTLELARRGYTLTVVGVEPAISADDESYNRLQGEQRRLWLDLLYAISAEPSIIGASRHLLYIGTKR